MKQKSGINLKLKVLWKNHDNQCCRSKRENLNFYEFLAEIKPHSNMLVFSFTRDQFSVTTDQ